MGFLASGPAIMTALNTAEGTGKNHARWTWPSTTLILGIRRSEPREKKCFNTWFLRKCGCQCGSQRRFG